LLVGLFLVRFRFSLTHGLGEQLCQDYMSNSVNRPAKRFNKIQIAIDSVTRFFPDYAEKKGLPIGEQPVV
jgi:hypothetical protein